MKRQIGVFAVVLLLFLLSPAVRAQSSQVQPGTLVRLTLLNGLSTSVAHTGDPFTAIVSEPVFIGTQMVVPAGAIVHGTVTDVTRPRMLAMFRGGASMNLVFNSIEVQSRLFPARMSILSIYAAGSDSGKKRKDLKTVEGVVVEENRDVKGAVEDIALGTGGGSVVGAIFSHVVRGTVIGLVGSSAYVVAKKGKEVELPAQTQFLVRMDSTVSLPTTVMRQASYSTYQ